MRQIKFRGKRISDGAWLYGDLMHLEKDFKPLIKIIDWSTKDQEVEPDTVSQFTGLTDRNGKEIYEGDIIKEKESDYSNEYRLYRVYWCDDNMQYWMSDDDTGDSFPLIELEIDYSIVIGSIQDNPELLDC